LKHSVYNNTPHHYEAHGLDTSPREMLPEDFEQMTGLKHSELAEQADSLSSR
jgi:hypothetical protein